jgi:prevent-host-death family protein
MNLNINKGDAQLAETVRRVSHGGERIVLNRNGKGVAALVPIEDLKFLEFIEELEDAADAKAAKKALADIKSGKTKLIPWEKVKADLIKRPKKS